MATVTVRNLDDKVVKDLKAQAKTNNRSLEAEIREILTRLSGESEWRRQVDRFRREADRIAAMTPKVPQTDSAELIRQMRDQR